MLKQCYICLALGLTVASVHGQGLTGQALLDDLSQRAVRYFWEQSNSQTGLTKDRANNHTSDNYDVASISATGYALASYAIGTERGWLDRQQALARTRLTFRTLINTSQQLRGWFYHFTNWQSGQRVWTCEVSSIDTALLLNGAIVAERYFQDSQVTADFNTLVGRIDWHWMLTNNGALANSQTFCHGWKPETGFLSSRWDTYCELMVLLIPALGASTSVPATVWTAFRRPVTYYQGIPVLVGGPLFMHQMAQTYYDFSKRRDKLGFNYWVSSQNATLANRLYCITNPGHYQNYSASYWGLSACDTPDGYRACGAPIWVDDNGTVAPSSPTASLNFTPNESQAVADNFSRNYPAYYGRYGFSNGVNATRNWVDTDVIGIDLGILMLAIEDKRDGLPQRLSMGSPIIKEGMRRATLNQVAEAGIDSCKLILDSHAQHK